MYVLGHYAEFSIVAPVTVYRVYTRISLRDLAELIYSMVCTIVLKLRNFQQPYGNLGETADNFVWLTDSSTLNGWQA